MRYLNWGELPSAEQIKSDIQREFDAAGKKTLYQFSLPILCRIYHWLEKSVPGVADGTAVSQRVPLPNEASDARSLLRAVAYFSWEKERHTFLIRRVYPMSFDFLSYSHVPDGWGALGLMRAQLNNADYKGYTCVSDIEESISLLPYLRESERLQYSSVLVVPVGNDELLGAFVFYLRDRNSLPPERVENEIKIKFQQLSSVMADAVEEHLEVIVKGVDKLPNLWRKLWRENSTLKADGTILELKLWINPLNAGAQTKLSKVFDDITASILSVLNTDKTFTIIDRPDIVSNENLLTFLTLGKATDALNLKEQILSAVGVAIGESCSQHDDLSFRFSCDNPELNKKQL